MVEISLWQTFLSIALYFMQLLKGRSDRKESKGVIKCKSTFIAKFNNILSNFDNFLNILNNWEDGDQTIFYKNHLLSYNVYYISLWVKLDDYRGSSQDHSTIHLLLNAVLCEKIQSFSHERKTFFVPFWVC